MPTPSSPRPEEALPRTLFPAILLLSLAVLMVQIALSRIFSFTIWYHFAYISISLALLGFGASGSMLVAFPRLGAGSVGARVALYCGLSSVSTLVMIALVGGIQLDPVRVLQSGEGLALFSLYFGIVSVPFFFAGLAITIALRAAGAEVNRLYFWDLIGAGLGCALVVYAIDWLETPRVVVLVAVLYAAAGLLASIGESRGVRNFNAAMLVLALLVIVPLPRMLPFQPAPDKNISPWLEQNAKHYHSRWGSLFRTDLIGAAEGEAIGGGYAGRGLSKNYSGPQPGYRMIFHDGGASAIMYQVTEDPAPLAMFQEHVLALPYVLKKTPETLIIGVGGGADILNAVQHGAKRVLGIELDPQTVDLITNDFSEFTGHVFRRPEVKIVASEGRHFVRTSADRYDLIQITGVDTLAALSSGAYILSENYLYTVEAYKEYFGKLRPDGIHSIGSGDFSPKRGYPRHALRFAALSREALAELGAAAPHRHIAIIGSPGLTAVFELLTKMQPFTEEEIAALVGFAEQHGFEPWYIPGRPAMQLPAFRDLLESSDAERERFHESTFLNLRPTTDDRPFFFSYYKWRHLFEHRDQIDKGHTLATGQIVLVLILGLATLFSIVAIVLPLARIRRSHTRMPGHWGFLVYFAALGVGFIFAEISFVQRFILFLGYPTYSLTVVLFAFLTAAAVGAHLSGRLPDRPGYVLPRLGLALTVLVVFYMASLTAIFDVFLSSSLPVRIAVTVLLCAPLGGLLGMFFPYGIRLTSAVSRDFVPWAWAINGCLTVVGSVLSIMLAMTFGFITVIGIFVVVYWIGIASFVRTSAQVGRSGETAAFGVKTISTVP